MQKSNFHPDRIRSDEPGAVGRSDQTDREAQLKLLAEQIAAVESAVVEPAAVESAAVESAAAGRGNGPGAGERGHEPDGVETGNEPGSAGRGGAGRNVGEQSPARQAAAARAICLRLLTIAPRPRAGLAQALKRKEIPDDIAESVLDRLTQVGLIDDVAYAQIFVRIKHRDRALGRTALRTELRRLGVAEESMADAVDTVDSEAERARAAELISKRLDAAMAVGSVAARRRLLGLLSRRGYPPEMAISVVDGAIAGYTDGQDQWS